MGYFFSFVVWYIVFNSFSVLMLRVFLALLRSYVNLGPKSRPTIYAIKKKKFSNLPHFDFHKWRSFPSKFRSFQQIIEILLKILSVHIFLYPSCLGIFGNFWGRERADFWFLSCNTRQVKEWLDRCPKWPIVWALIDSWRSRSTFSITILMKEVRNRYIFV